MGGKPSSCTTGMLTERPNSDMEAIMMAVAGATAFTSTKQGPHQGDDGRLIVRPGTFSDRAPGPGAPRSHGSRR